MAHRRTKPQANQIPSTALVASAARFSGGKIPRIYRGAEGWQKECYRHYSICGEARFAADFFGSALSRASLVVKRLVDGVDSTVTEGRVWELLSALAPGPKGQSQMLKSIGRHMTIAGECYLVGRTIAPTDDEGNRLDVPGTDVWEIIAVTEITVNGNAWSITREGEQQIILSEDDVVLRIWIPAPDNAMRAHSPFKSLLPILQEIEWLTNHEWAQLTSRLAGAGILFLPQGMTFPDTENGGNEAESFLSMLGKVMMATVNDPSKPESLVPTVVTAPAEAIAAVQHMKFWSDLDSASVELRTEAIRRFAVGMDLPVEQVLGMSSNGGTGGGSSNGVSHWGAWQIEEATIKMHVEPMLDTLIHAISIGIIAPVEPNTADRVDYDTSHLRLRPDRSREAMELYQEGALSMARMLEENGFSADDIPKDDERKEFYLRKIASGSATPEQVEAALLALGVTLNSSQFQSLEDQGETRETPAPRSLEEHPSRPRTPDESAALVASCEGLVLQALDRSGRRLLNAVTRGAGGPAGKDPLSAHIENRVNGSAKTLLAGGFNAAPLMLDEPDDLVPVLESYCASIFERQVAYSRSDLKEHLRTNGVLA